MKTPDVKVEVLVTLTLTITDAQARDVMDDLLKTDERLGGPAFSSDGSQAVYYALAEALGERVL